MASVAGPRTVEDGLILHLDAANPRSYRGPTGFNLINSVIDSYPTVGNAWATYQVDQRTYNNATPFGIGIDNVTNNIIATTGPHQLKTFDVLYPMSSGGGVTANIRYYIKAHTATGFSLHAYSATQDGSQTFSVLDPVINDVRQPVFSSGFPTTWYGSAHNPNCDTIKTIVPNGFNHEGRVHDCVRINWFRPDGRGGGGGDGWVGGMAYGVLPTVAAGTTFTWSFYHKAGSPSAIGRACTFQVYFTSNASAAYSSFTPQPYWQRNTLVASTPGITTGQCYMYWFSATGNCAVDIAEIQLEQGNYPTPFFPTFRGSTAGSGGGWNDLTYSLNQFELINGNGYTGSNGNGIVLDGTDDYLITTEAKGLPLGASSRTISIWTKFSTLTNNFVQIGSAPEQRYIFEVYDVSGTVYLYTDGVNGANNLTISGSEVPSLNVWNNLVFMNDGQNWKYFLNGELKKSGTFPVTLNTGGNKVIIGKRDDYPSNTVNGTVSVVSIYNRALSNDEVKQNFNAQRKRFGI